MDLGSSLLSVLRQRPTAIHLGRVGTGGRLNSDTEEVCDNDTQVFQRVASTREVEQAHWVSNRVWVFKEQGHLSSLARRAVLADWSVTQVPFFT